MEKIELLAPAGNKECLKVAVENGADAVYFGLSKFNARRKADNLSLDEIKEVINYCHQKGVRAYCTLNTLVKNNEIKEFFLLLNQIYAAGIDAVIIQEISFLPIIKQNFPRLEVHISTQAAITNSYCAELVKQADKIILPREFNKEQIQSFVKKTSRPVEIFVHGALCFSYSGKCLFSSFLGEKSGNRGYCAQPCRKKYNQRYLLSMKDLCLIYKIPEIIQSGVSSLKIEGRLRNPKYVAAATKAYRTVIDSYYQNRFAVDPELYKEMKLAFNRKYTEGYFSKEEELVASEKPFSRGLFLGIIEKDNTIKLEEGIQIGDGLGIWRKEKVDGAVVTKIEKEGKFVDKAEKGDLVKLFVRAEKGAKVYKTSSFEKVKEIQFSPKPPIIIKRKSVQLVLPEIAKKNSGQEELLVKVYSKKEAESARQSGAEAVFYNLFSPDYSPAYGAYVPRLLTDEEVEKAVKKINVLGVKKILVGDLGVYALLKERKDLRLYLDYSLNIFNDYSLSFFSPAIPIISPELSLEELKEFQNKDFAVFVQGKIALMNTKYQKLPVVITDEKNYSFPVRKEHAYYQILNSKELALLEEIKKLKPEGITKYYLDLEKNSAKIIKLYQLILKSKKGGFNKEGYTKGHWERKVI